MRILERTDLTDQEKVRWIFGGSSFREIWRVFKGRRWRLLLTIQEWWHTR